MLIADADLDPDTLENRIVEYRKKKVGEVLSIGTDQTQDTNVIELPVRTPGRPRRVG